MSDSFGSIIKELEDLKKEQEDIFRDDIVTNTLSKLLDIEKQALYGNLKNKNKRFEDVVLTGLKFYKEREDANKES